MKRQMTALAVPFLSILFVFQSQEIEKLSGKVSSLSETTLRVAEERGIIRNFHVDAVFLKEINLKVGERVTVFFRSKPEQVTGIQKGDEIWHQRACSRDNCICQDHKCKPRCLCR